MTDNPRTPARIEFDYTFVKFHDAVDKCDNSTISWGVAATRANALGLCRKEFTESEYGYQEKKISDMSKNFSKNCESRLIKRRDLLNIIKEYGQQD